MKKVSLAATVALSLLGATTFAAANGTVKSQPAAKTAAATTVAAPATAAAAAVPATVSTGGALNPGSAELIARPGNRRNTNFELDVMIPVFQPSCGDRLLAIDIRGMRDVRRNTEGNFGAVYRQIINNSFVLGGYVYGDYRRTSTKNNVGQLTLGADILSNMVDARFNGYIAQSKKKMIAGASRVAPTANTIARFDQYEVAQSGFDGEVGVRVPMPGMNNIETRVFAGGYRFSRSGTKTMAGPRGRLEVRILDLVNPGSRLTLGVDVSNDKVRKTTVNGVIGLRIPLQFISGGKVPQGLQRRLADYVHRDINVNTSAVEKQGANVKDADTGNDVKIRWTKVSSTAAATETGTGTFENPFVKPDSMITTAPQAGTYDRLIGAGTISYATTITPSNWYTFAGPATDLTVTDAKDNTTFTVLKATTDVVNIVGTGAANKTLITLGSENPTIRKLGGFTHTPAVDGSSLITGVYTANATVNIADVKSVGFAPTAPTQQINVGFSGQDVTNGALTVARSTFTNYSVLNDTAILSKTQNGATSVVIADTLTYTGVAGGLGIIVSLENTDGKLTYTDKGSKFTNGRRAYQVLDSSTSTTQQGTTTFTITDATVSGISVAGLGVYRDAVGIMSNSKITGTVTNAKFTSSTGQDIIVDAAGTGAVASSVALNLNNITHTNTGTASALKVSQQATVDNASTAVITMNNVKASGAAGDGILIATTAANTANAITLNMTNVVTTGYARGIGLSGTALGATANQILIGIAGGGNSIAGTAQSFNSNATTPAAGAVGVVLAATGAGVPIVTGAVPAAFKSQFVGPIVY